ncbi:MAG: hypothetical protein WCR21_06135 [Bacteroidota bacterium]
MKNTAPIYFLFLLAFLSCTKKQTVDSDAVLGLDYYPFVSGKYIIYQVDSTVYGDLHKDTVVYKYLLKEKIADTYTDNTGSKAIRIERFIKRFNSKKSYDSLPWLVKDVFMLNAGKKSIQILEGNVRFTKLAFPVQAKATWDGNAGNNLGEQMYKYDYIDNAESMNGKAFDNVCTVIQKSFHPLVLDQNYVEKYAKGFGLIYKEITDVVSNSPGANYTLPVLKRIESGAIYKQTFLSIGYE